MFTLNKQQPIGQYTVVFPIKEGDYAETYRVKDASGKNFFLKLIDIGKCGARQFDADSNLIEVDIVQGLDHPCLMHLVEHWETALHGRAVACMVSDFISGETLEQLYLREQRSNPYTVRTWMLDALEGLQYLHSRPDPIIHNELTPHNIMLDAVSHRAVVIDFGHARRASQGRRAFDRQGLSPLYLAPEVLGGGLFSVQSDLFTLGVTAYRLLYGILPWQTGKGDDADETLQAQREQPLRVPTLSNVPAPDSMVEAIAKALAPAPADRFRSADEMARALKGELHVSAPMRKMEDNKSARQQDNKTTRPRDNKTSKPRDNKPQGNGLKDVAGMRDLKALLQRDVIDLLRTPEKYRRYGITLPNGLLLYGPPGCGKTFFAKKLAEEVGFNFIMRTPSDLKSKWVNATQENIAALFREAEENAPSIIFIDEINELLPRRTGDAHEMSRSAVNEMLAQMDRTGERGVFVIGATNLPEQIDEAMLRSGRLEKQIEVGPPDHEARREMFEMYLRDRYVDLGLDYNRLSTLTDGYVSSDIRFIVDEAAKKAMARDVRIGMTTLEETIASTPSSLKAQTNRKPIGFKP